MQDGCLNHSCFLFAWPDAQFCSPSKPEALISIVFLRYQLSVPSNWVHVRFFDKHREHYKLEFGSLPQNCHIAIQYLIIFSATTSSSGVELKLSKFLKNPLDVYQNCQNCVILMIVAYPLQLNKHQDFQTC